MGWHLQPYCIESLQAVAGLVQITVHSNIYITPLQILWNSNLAMSDDLSADTGHPARKLDPAELKQFLAEKRETVPAITKRIAAQKFSHVEPQTVRTNLNKLADNNEICRYNDGDVVLYWYPRETDDAGDVPHEDVFDDSVDYSEIEPGEVPRDTAEEIALARLPYYQPGSLWRDFASIFQFGIMFSFGVMFLGIGELVSSSFGLQETMASMILRGGFYLSVVTTTLYVVSVLLDVLASWGYISRDPYPEFRKLFY